MSLTDRIEREMNREKRLDLIGLSAQIELTDKLIQRLGQPGVHNPMKLLRLIRDEAITQREALLADCDAQLEECEDGFGRLLDDLAADAIGTAAQL